MQNSRWGSCAGHISAIPSSIISTTSHNSQHPSELDSLPLPGEYVSLQIFLRSEAGQKELNRWPQYHGCLVPAYGGKRLHLKTLQYFLLWTAFYVLRTAHTSSSDAMGPRPPQTTRLGHFKQVDQQPCAPPVSVLSPQPTPASSVTDSSCCRLTVAACV